MSKPDLTVVAQHSREPSPRQLSPLTLLLGALLIAAGIVATFCGADIARRPPAAEQLAEQALEQALHHGNEDPLVLATLTELRRTLDRRPLDSRTRVIYAGLLLSMIKQVEDSSIVSSHALRAAELAPVTVPVIRLAAMTLAFAAEAEEALRLARQMYAYDETAAAELLSELRPLVFRIPIEDGIPDDPAAWLAWARQLRIDGLSEEADEWTRKTHQRWPADLHALRLVAAQAIQSRDWDALATLFPADRTLPAKAAAAPALTYRAQLKGRRGGRAAALEDIALALQLDPDSNLVRILAAEAHAAIDNFVEARRLWNRALHDLPATDTKTRRNILASLARLEERHGQPAVALRLWRDVLELEPGHAEAARRVRILSSR